MRRFLAILCTLAILCSAVNLAVFAAEADNQSAGIVQEISEDVSGIIVLEEDTENLEISETTYLDLNGHSVKNLSVTAEGDVVAYIADSATNDYTVADGVYGKITGTVTGNVVPAQGYMQVTEGEALSFHRVNLEIYSMTLRPDVTGVYYTSNFAGDEVVAAQVQSYGVALSVKGEPVPGEAFCGYSTFTGFQAGEGANAAASGTLLKNILKTTNTDAVNTRNANMAVLGRAYVKTAEGYVYGQTVTRSLKEQVEAVDEIFAELQPLQMAAAVAMYKNYTAVMEGWNLPNIVNYVETGIEPGINGEITLPITAEIVDGVVAQEVTVNKGGISVTVPQGVQLAEGATSLSLQITPLESSEAEINLTDDQVIMPVDVHVEGVSAQNTVPLTVNLGKVMAKNLNMGTYAIYHVENGKAAEMVLIPADQSFTAHNQYKYTLDGELTLYMATFSEVAVVSSVNNYWQGEIDYSWYDVEATELYIRNADQLAGLNKIVSGDAGEIAKDDFENKTVTLVSDIAFHKFTSDATEDEHHLVWYPIGYWKTQEGVNKAGETWYDYGGAFCGTFNGNGHKVSNIFQRTWDMDGNYDAGYWDAAMGLFGYVYGGTVQNLTIDNFYSVGEFTVTGCVSTYAASDAVFENISLTDCHPQGYNIPVAGVVGTTSSDDGKASNLIFRNISVDNTNTISALWGTYDACCAGILAGMQTNTTVLLKNCHVAAKMDVYNDVCGNYQYYWYRGSGMLVGGIRKLNAARNEVDISGITTENCTVDFGDWNNYYYCEFEKNGNPSYCNKEQDFKFSRIPETDYTVDENGTAVCNHDHTAKEDNQAIYLPFYQLYAGRDGSRAYGIRNVGFGNIEDYENQDVTINAKPTNAQKFVAAVPANTMFMKGSEVTLGELFSVVQPDWYLPINDESVWANAVDVATGYDVATFTRNEEDWTKSTLTFDSNFAGKVKITIQDYQFCTPTSLECKITFEGDANLPVEIETEINRAKAIGEMDPAEVIAGTTCPMCGAENVTWTAAGYSLGVHNGAVKHFYFRGLNDFTSETTYYLFNSQGENSKICVVLDDADVRMKGMIRTQKGSNITLNIMGNGTITSTGENTTDMGLILAQATDSTINLYGGTYIYTGASNNGNYPAIQAQDGSDINIYNDTIIGKAAQDRTTANYNVRVTGAGSTLNMYGGTIRNGVTGVGGSTPISGNIHLASNAVFNMYGGTVTGGTSATGVSASGGNIYSGGNGVNIYGGTISGGFAGSMGGNIYHMASTGNVNISGGTITGGAAANGGNITMYRNALNVSGTALIENGKGSKDGTTIDGNAGNVCLSSGNATSLNMTGGTIRGGQAAIGGNIHAQTNPNANGAEAFNISGGTITGGSASTANGRGGNINTARPGTIGANAVISDGTALRGGNIYMEAGAAVTTSGTITGGTALMSGTIAGYGGNIAAAENLTVTGGTIANGKVQAAEGVTLTTACLGGNIYNNDKTLTISGGYIYGGEVVGATDADVLQTGNIYSNGGSMNISGGAIAGDTKMRSTANLTLSGSPVINTTITLADGTQKTAVAGLGFMLPGRAYVDVSALNSDADIAIYDNGVAFLVANDNNVNLTRVFHNVDRTKYAIVRDDGMMILEEDHSFDVNRELNYCEACQAFVAWEALTEEEITTAEGDHLHYYLSDDLNYDGAEGLFQPIMVSGRTICLHLNGKTLSLADYIYVGSGAVVNIFADNGVVNGALSGDTGTFNLYGGTYRVDSGNNIAVGRPGCNINVYEGAVIENKINLKQGTLTLNDTATVNNLVISSTNGNVGKLVIAEGWTGTAVVDIDASLITDGIVSASAVELPANLQGTIVDTDGVALVKKACGQLGYEKAFDPAAETNYCRICDAYVAWETAPTTAPAEALPAGSHVHYYVPEDMTYDDDEGMFFTEVKNSSGTARVQICLYLNNKTLTVPSYVYSGSGAIVNIIGEGTVNSLLGDTCTFNLYGGTYTGGTVLFSTGGCKVIAYEDAEIKSTVKLNKGTLTLKDSASVEDLVLSGTGKLVIEEGWSGTAVVDIDASLITDGIVSASAVELPANFTGTIQDTAGIVFIVDANGQLCYDYSFDPERELNYCRICDAYVAWETAPTAAPAEALPAGSHVHYYVPEDMTFDSEDMGMFQVEVSKSTGTARVQICLYLNNKTLTVPTYVYSGSGAIVNIIGEGTVNSLLGDTCTFNLYGGTYAGGTVLFSTAGCKVIAYEDAEIKSTVKLNKGTLTLNDSASVEDLVVSGTGKLVLAEGWSGSVAITCDDAALIETAVTFPANYTGTITVNGEAYVG